VHKWEDKLAATEFSPRTASASLRFSLVLSPESTCQKFKLRSRLKLPGRQKESKVAKDASQSADVAAPQVSQQPALPAGTSSGSHLSNQPSPSGQTNMSESTIRTNSQPAQQPVGISSQSNLRDELFPSGQTYGLRVLHEPPNPIVDIVFIHGLTGDSYDTWLERKSGIYWPKGLLCKDVPDARIMAFGYDADVTKILGPVSQNRLADHAGSLLADLANTRDKEESVRIPSF
jgi:hypothetical protein